MSNQPLLAILSPNDEDVHVLAERLRNDAPGFDVEVAEYDAAVRELVARADAAFGWVPPEA